MKGMWQKLNIRFLRHETWAIQKSIDNPKNSLLYVATTWIWIIALWFASLPAIIYWNETYVGELDFLNIFYTSPVWSASSLALAIIWMIAAIWWVHFYLICASLMFGSQKIAQAKLAKTQAKLKALTDA